MCDASPLGLLFLLQLPEEDSSAFSELFSLPPKKKRRRQVCEIHVLLFICLYIMCTMPWRLES